MDTQKAVLELIIDERKRQDEKWEGQRHLHETWELIASEEKGEIARALLEGNIDQLKIEIIELAAVLVAWYEAIESGKVIDVPAFVRHIFKCGYGYADMDMSTDSIEQKLAKAIDLWESLNE